MSAGSNGDGAPFSELADRIVEIACSIPCGRVSSYKDVGIAAGCGPRYVGTIMGKFGAFAPWWRVVRSDGTSHVWQEALPHWDEEHIAYSRTGTVRVDMAAPAWPPGLRGR